MTEKFRHNKIVHQHPAPDASIEMFSLDKRSQTERRKKKDWIHR